MKRVKMNIIYSSICGSYLVKSRPERTTEMMEKILFLMQHESFAVHGVPFLEYPVYIDGNKIKIPYISDLLRIHQPVLTIYYRSHYSYYERIYNTYHKMLNRYRRYSEEEIHVAVKKILETETLDSKYYVYGKYDNMWNLRLARLEVNATTHYIVNILRMFLLYLPLPCFILGVGYAYFISETTDAVFYLNRVKELLKIAVASTAIGAFWTYKFLNLTAYERSKMIGERYDYKL